MKAMLTMLFVASGLIGGGALLNRAGPAAPSAAEQLSCEPEGTPDSDASGFSCLECVRAGGYCCRVGNKPACC